MGKEGRERKGVRPAHFSDASAAYVRPLLTIKLDNPDVSRFIISSIYLIAVSYTHLTLPTIYSV